MQSSNLFAKLCEIRDKVVMGPQEGALCKLPTYYHLGVNENEKKIYLCAEVWPDSLDKGTDLSPVSQQCAKTQGIVGDEPAHARLGELNYGNL